MPKQSYSMIDESEFQKDLTKLINRHSLENKSDTPDFILASYLTRCLETWNLITQDRDTWYNRAQKENK